MSGTQGEAVSKKKGRVKIQDVTPENDIRYRGPLNFQHFQLLGWLCIAISQVAVILHLGAKLDPGLGAQTASLSTALTSILDLSLPFLLIANFAQILDTSEGYRAQLIKNAAAMAAVWAVSCLVYYRYIVDSLAILLTNPSQAMPAVKSVLDSVVPHGFFAYNIFTDLFLCTLTMLFLNYEPRRLFKGRARLLFRLMALLPIACEVFCMVLKRRSARGLVVIPPWAYPLLTVKPPMTFVLFIALAMYVKLRELRFRRYGKTHEEYRAFLGTNRNSWDVSVFLAIMLVVVSLLDIGVMLGFTVGDVLESTIPGIRQEQPEDITDEERTEWYRQRIGEQLGDEAPLNAALTQSMDNALAVGFGGSSALFILAPVVLLFSYTRKPRQPWLGLLIPVAGICLILFVYLEGAHRLLFHLPFDKIDLEELRQTADMYSNVMLQ